MTFNEILPQFKDGKKIRRREWNDNVYFVKDDGPFVCMRAENWRELARVGKDRFIYKEPVADTLLRKYSIYDNFLSFADVCAEDWEVLE